MSVAMALVRSLKAEALKTAGLPGVRVGATLALVLPALVEYYTDHDLPARLAAGDPRALAGLDGVGVIGLYMGTTGIVVLAASVVVSEYASDPRTNGASRQVTTTMLVQPRRGASVAAKLLVVLGAATVLLAVAWTATYSLCRHLLGSWAPLDPVPWPLLTGILAWWGFSAMASMALAAATRSALVPMTVLVAMSTMISPGVLLIKSTDAARFLPDTAAVRLIANPTTLNYDRLVELLSIPMAAAVCTAWASGCAAVCCWVWMRRDA
ncbi:ABC transporter [Actinomyces massiliensis]|uniref:ABC transporter n=1 Tax=Actinomyces massiliensis TaxID=461393 RepID=UPI0003046837|nr:ABC transporter [Actinomyces massiliensis]